MKKILIVMLSATLILNSLTFNISASAAVVTAGKPAAKLLFTFDDGWKDNLTVAAPILDAAGFKGTAYVCEDASTQSWGAADYMNVADLNTLYNQYGWDIGNHTATHPNDGNLTDAATLQKLTTEYKNCQDWILSNKWDRGAYHVCYPSGMFSDQLISILQGMGVKTGRTTLDGLQTIPVASYYKLPVQYVENGNVTAVENYISSAVDSGSTAVLMLHKVEVNAGDLVITKNDFQTIVDYARSFADKSQLEVTTISEWYNELTNTNTNTDTDTNANSNTNAEAPEITTQPEDATAAVSEKANLQVSASVGTGKLSYQWYSNTTDSSSGGKSISGAAGSSYLAPTTTAGTTYYYCVVTNTDNTAQGNKIAAAASSTAKVTVNPNCTVTFNVNGGTTVSNQSVKYNGNAKEPSAPAKDGYTFGGWYTDAALTKVFNFTATLTGNITLYAKWIPVEEKAVSVSYQAHVQNIGWQNWVSDGQEAGTIGQSLRAEALKINLVNAPAGAKIKYQAHVQNIGWQDWVSSGQEAGTDGRSLRVEAIRISLENMPGYSIQYQAHVQNVGWQNWVSDGQEAGTDGQSLRLEAIRIRIVKN